MASIPPSTITTPTVLSAQSQVCGGHVGNGAAVFPLQRNGVEVISLPTAVLSNHNGYPNVGSIPVNAQDLRAVLRSLGHNGFLGRCDAVLSGYLTETSGPVVVDAVQQIRARGGAGHYLCDPVMGDDGRCYVSDGVVQMMRELVVPAADIITPNLFELAMLTDRPGLATCPGPTSCPGGRTATGARGDGNSMPTCAEVVAAARSLMGSAPMGSARDDAEHHAGTWHVMSHTTGQNPFRPRASGATVAGPRAVVVTSVRAADLPGDQTHVMTVAPTSAWVCSTPTLSRHFSGSGDLFAALLLAGLLHGQQKNGDARLSEAVARAARQTWLVLSATASDAPESEEPGELALVAHQDLLTVQENAATRRLAQ